MKRTMIALSLMVLSTAAQAQTPLTHKDCINLVNAIVAVAKARDAGITQSTAVSYVNNSDELTTKTKKGTLQMIEAVYNGPFADSSPAGIRRNMTTFCAETYSK